MATATFITKAEGWETGEARGPNQEKIEAQADGALGQGDLVYFSGLTSVTEGILKAKKPPTTANDGTQVRGMALHAAADGEMVDILIKGIAKPVNVNDAAAIAVGDAVGNKAGKLIKPAASNTSAGFAVALSAGAAAGGDHLLLYFNGMVGSSVP